MTPTTPLPGIKKRKHVTLTIAKKIEIVKRLKKGEKQVKSCWTMRLVRLPFRLRY